MLRGNSTVGFMMVDSGLPAQVFSYLIVTCGPQYIITHIYTFFQLLLLNRVKIIIVIHVGLRKEGGRQEVDRNCVCISEFVQSQPFFTRIYPQLTESDDGFVDRLLVCIPKTRVLREEVRQEIKVTLQSYVDNSTQRLLMTGVRSSKTSPSMTWRRHLKMLLIGMAQMNNMCTSLMTKECRCIACLLMKWQKK